MTDRAEILELYKVFVDTITANEQRRQTLSAFYTSLIAAGAALLGSGRHYDPVWIVSAVLVVSLIWFLTMRYFRRLAQAKFKVIGEMETHFELRPFELEWRHFKNKSSTDSETVKPRKWSRWTLTHFDQVIPLLAAISSAGYLLYRVFVDPNCPSS